MDYTGTGRRNLYAPLGRWIYLTFTSPQVSPSSRKTPSCLLDFDVVKMASEDYSHQTNNRATEQPNSEKALVDPSAQDSGQNAVEDPEQIVVEDAEKNAVEETPESKPESQGSKPEEKPLGWGRLLLIGIGIWFAVFLYSLVSHPAN